MWLSGWRFFFHSLKREKKNFLGVVIFAHVCIISAFLLFLLTYKKIVRCHKIMWKKKTKTELMLRILIYVFLIMCVSPSLLLSAFFPEQVLVKTFLKVV